MGNDNYFDNQVNDFTFSADVDDALYYNNDSELSADIDMIING